MAKFVTFFKKHTLDLVKWHLRSLLYYLDPVMVTSKLKYQHQAISTFSSSSSWDFTFLFLIVAMLVCIFYGNVYMVYDHHNTIGYFNSTVFKNSPVALNHQILPRPVWPQTDVALTISFTISTFIYCTFLRRPYTAGRYQLTATNVVTVSGKGKIYSKYI